MKLMFSDFLTNSDVYKQAQSYWEQVWNDLPEFDRQAHGWRTNWFASRAPFDGNPIFTALSDTEQKGIRIIQYLPTQPTPEIDFWLDTFGGPITNPRAVRELVISCSLSLETENVARKLMGAWVNGNVIETTWTESGQLEIGAPRNPRNSVPLKAA